MIPKPLFVEIIPALSDNYIFLLHSEEHKETVAVDPCQAEPVLAFLRARQWSLTAIWNTHHHGDHVGGNRELKEATGCQIIGSRSDSARIPGIDQRYQEGDGFQWAGCEVRVLDTSGHTQGAISFWLPKPGLLFCGDTLFAMGCGRLFEGSPQEMWASLGKIKSLPQDTKIYCAHEYTEANGRFALSIEPENQALQERLLQVRQLRAQERPSIPSLLGEELATNPFLRAGEPTIRRSLQLEEAEDWQVFAEIRARKDRF